jgi:molybdenum cofactor guanylyltransferase
MTGVTGIVLCGGRSTRMGRDKGALPFGNETMLDRISRILGEVAGDLIVVGRRDQSATMVHDAVEDQGPLAGIAAGLSASKTELNLVVACDMPLIKPAVLTLLVNAIGDDQACVGMTDDQRRPLPGVYRKELAGVAQSLLAQGERRLTELLRRARTQTVAASEMRRADPGLDTYLGCNTPEELRLALLRSQY